jgi:hypothetical protein
MLLSPLDNLANANNFLLIYGFDGLPETGFSQVVPVLDR